MPKVGKKLALKKKPVPKPVPPEVRLARFADKEAILAKDLIKFPHLLEKYSIRADDGMLPALAGLADAYNRGEMAKFIAKRKR